jgi:nucleoside-diphosphate-sugar epimerase
METALVTGGAGFIGAHLVKRLAGEGIPVVVVDDLSWGDPAKLDRLANVRLIEADLADIGAHRQALKGVSHVFHLAALISAYDSLVTPDAYIRTNVTGLLRVLEACSDLRHPKLVFASTSGVYGNASAAARRENDPVTPATVYALTKLAGEHLLDMYRQRMGYDDVSLRLFNVYGPGQNLKHPYANVTCKFAHAAALGESVQLFGDGTQSRDFIHVDDVVEAMLRVARAPCRHRVYNVGTGESASIASLLALAQELAQTEIVVEHRPAWPNDIQAISADITRLESEFGFRAAVSLRAGLTDTIRPFQHGA